MRTREKGSSHESAGTKQSVRLSVLSGQQTVGREFTPCTPPTHEISLVGTAERAELHPSVARAGLGSDVLAGLAWDSGRIQGVNSLPIFSRPYGTEKWLSPPHSKNVVRRFWLANQDRLLAVIRRPHDIVCADEFGVETGIAIFQKHSDHLSEILLQLVEQLAMGVGSGKSWNIAHVKSGLGATFDNGSERSHRGEPKWLLLQSQSCL